VHPRRTTICCRCFARITARLTVLVAAAFLWIPQSAAQRLPDTVKWSVPVAAPLGAPVLAGSIVVVPLQTAVVGHRLNDGQRIWTTELIAEQPLASDDERVYVAAGEALHALNATNGTVAWRVGGTGKVAAPPLARAGWVIAAIGGEVLALNANDGTVVWRKTVGSMEFRPALDGDLLIVPAVDGRVLAINLEDGTERWTKMLDAEPTEPYVIGERVYLTTAAKLFVTLRAGSGRVESRIQVGALTKGHAASDEHHIYFAAMDNLLWATDRGDGAIEWRKPLQYRPAGGPVLLEGVVIVPSYVAALPAFNVKDGTDAGQLTFPVRLAMLPLFAHAEGVQAVIAITGENDWTLSMRVPSFLPPAPPMQPLTELPGVAVPPPRLPG
jgi:outer membrane protein assembly factor BamB